MGSVDLFYTECDVTKGVLFFPKSPKLLKISMPVKFPGEMTLTSDIIIE